MRGRKKEESLWIEFSTELDSGEIGRSFGFISKENFYFYGFRNPNRNKAIRTIDLSPLSEQDGYFSCVHITNTGISDIDLSPISRLSYMRNLHLSENRLSSINLKPLRTLRNLEILDLHRNQIESIDLTPISTLSNLKKLLLYDNCITEISLNPLRFCGSLTYFDVKGNQIDTLDISPLISIKPYPNPYDTMEFVLYRDAMTICRAQLLIKDKCDSEVWERIAQGKIEWYSSEKSGSAFKSSTSTEIEKNLSSNDEILSILGELDGKIESLLSNTHYLMVKAGETQDSIDKIDKSLIVLQENNSEKARLAKAILNMLSESLRELTNTESSVEQATERIEQRIDEISKALGTEKKLTERLKSVVRSTLGNLAKTGVANLLWSCAKGILTILGFPIPV